jgi:hypothetical protein
MVKNATNMTACLSDS